MQVCETFKNAYPSSSHAGACVVVVALDGIDSLVEACRATDFETKVTVTKADIDEAIQEFANLQILSNMIPAPVPVVSSIAVPIPAPVPVPAVSSIAAPIPMLLSAPNQVFLCFLRFDVCRERCRK